MAREASFRLMVFLLVLLAAACNLSNAPEEQQITLTDIPTNTPPVTRTLLPTGGVPTTLPITTLSVPTTVAQQFPTAQLPPTVVALFPSPTPAPISIVILSPIPGNVVAGNVQVLGAAIHPLFLQYQLEFGPDPNPGNLWYPATGISQQPVVNGLLGIWNTTAIQDSTYQLRLRVTLRDGTSLATVVNNIRIQNQAPTPIPSATPNIQRPIAAFTQDRTSGLSPLVVRFFNQSSGVINTYFWTFGDGGSSSEANPIYTFRNPGVYTVTLTVSGPGGSSNFSQQINVQTATAPVAAFTQDKTSGPSPLTVQFTNQSTGVISSYSWNFGDGATSTEQNPLHQFTAVGTYNVILSVTGPGGTSFVTRKITVEDPVIPAPVAAFTPDKTTGTSPLTVVFTNASTGQITSYVWDFGNGQTSTDKNAVQTFSNAGTYRVRLTAIGPGGQSTAESTITVSQPPNAPTAAFTPSVTSGNIPLIVQFTNQSTGQITSYAWNFGDGTTSTEASPSHTFTSPGTYTVRLAVTGPGGTTETQATITATKPIAAPVAAFSANPTSGTLPLTVNFSNQSTGESLSFAWDFGDGQTSSEVNPSHIYTTAGNYTVKLTASNSAGSQTAQAVITVSQAAPTATATIPPTATSTVAPPAAPIASFTSDVTTGTAPLTVNLTSTSTGDISSYAWTVQDSGGNLVATGDQPTLTTSLPNAGDYTVNLTVTGPGGSSTATPLTVSVSAAAVPPVASFTSDVTTGTAPLTVNLTSTSTGDISSYAWTVQDSGGNVIATGDQPTLTTSLPNAGDYTINLTVTGPGGSSTAIPLTISVSAAAVPPVASFTSDVTTGTAPLTVNLSSTSTGDISSYAWTVQDSGGNIIATGDQPTLTTSLPNAGDYTVNLTVTGPGGSSTATPLTISVSPAAVPPVASFTSDVTTGTAPLTVNLSSTSTGDISSYAWTVQDSGGNVVATGDQPTLTTSLPSAGDYTINLTVTGPGGSSAATPLTISVSAAAVPPVASFTSDVTTGTAPLTVNLSSTSTGDISSYAWTVQDSGGNIIATGDQPTLTTSLPNAGDYTVNLTVTGPGGSSTATPLTISVSPAAPSISSSIAFVTDRDGNDEIYRLDPDGTRTNLTSYPAQDTDPAWSFDGNLIAFTSDRDGNSEIYIMNADGSDARRVTTDTDVIADDTGPTWTPDGRIVFVTNRDGNNELYIVNADGSGLTNLTLNPANDVSPAVSPDGSRVVFMSDRDRNNDLHLLNLGDGSVVNLTNHPGLDASPTWTPDGRILFVSDRDTAFAQIYAMNADGSNVIRLSDGSNADIAPAMTPDGSRIAFESQRDGFSQIYVMNADGSNVVRLSDGSAAESSPAWQP